MVQRLKHTAFYLLVHAAAVLGPSLAGGKAANAVRTSMVTTGNHHENYHG